MKSVVINYKDTVGVDNLSAVFWTLHGSLENANKEVSENEEKILAHFFKKIKKDFGINSTLKSKIITYLEARNSTKNVDLLFDTDEIQIAKEAIINTLSVIKEKSLKEFDLSEVRKNSIEIKFLLESSDSDDKDMVISYLNFVTKKEPLFSTEEKKQLNIVLNASIEDAIFLKNKEISELKRKYLILENL